MVINTATRKFDVYIDDQLLGSQWSYRYSAVKTLDEFLVSNSGNVNSSMSFDDVKVSYIPAAPAGLQADASDTTSVHLSWQAASGAAAYRLYRSDSADGDFVRLGGGDLTGLSYTDTGLTPGTRYYYKLAAVNQTAVSQESAILAADTSPLLSPDSSGSLPDGTVAPQDGKTEQSADSADLPSGDAEPVKNPETSARSRQNPFLFVLLGAAGAVSLIAGAFRLRRKRQ